MSKLACPTHDELLSYVVGRLPEDSADALAVHVDECSDCQMTLSDVDEGEDTLVVGLRESAAENLFQDEPECSESVRLLESLVSPGGAAGQLSRLGEYQLLEKLGQGGMGTVYKAVHTKLDRMVALKVLPRNRMDDPRAVARFEREMKAVGALDHPNIVRGLDAREIDGTCLLVMEYIEGLDLSKLVRRLGPLPIADACELVRQVAKGLQAAHQHGLVHRDVKPSNLMLADTGEVKLLDLGLARITADQPADVEMTEAGQTMGTADYMAPEQASDSRKVDIRADIYSLGCTLYKLLCGHAPFGGSQYHSAFDKMKAHTTEPIPSIQDRRAEVPDGLAALLDRMLAKDPADRFAEPAEVTRAIEPFTTGCDLAALVTQARQIEETGESVRPAILAQPQPVPSRGRRRWRTMAISASLAGIVLLGAVFALNTPDEKSPAVTASNALPAKQRQESAAKTLGLPVKYTNDIGMELVLIPAGEFEMGSSWDEIRTFRKQAKELDLIDWYAKHAPDEGPKHRVKLTRPFYMGKYEVTVAQFRQFVQETNYKTEVESSGRGGQTLRLMTGEWQHNPDLNWKNAGFKQDDNHPVVQVTINDAKRFCQWLGKKEGEPKRYSLPTEAQWEYACRAGTTTQFNSGEDPSELQHVANLGDAAFKREFAATERRSLAWDDGYAFTAQVGKFRPNAFGLYDMHGNVSEYCRDHWSPTFYEQSPLVNPVAPAAWFILTRGGNWLYGYAGYSRSAHRHPEIPDVRTSSYGFRVVWTIKRGDDIKVKIELDHTEAEKSLAAVAPSELQAGTEAEKSRAVAASVESPATDETEESPPLAASNESPASDEAEKSPAVAASNELPAKERQERTAKALEIPVKYSNDVGMELALIPPGEFEMGSTWEEISTFQKRAKERELDDWYKQRLLDEGPKHRVKLTRPFYMGKYEVTVGQFRQFVQEANYKTEAESNAPGGWILRPMTADRIWDSDCNWRNPGFEQDDNHPVVLVSINDANRFCQWLSQKEGEPKRYSLPTEAQWEYACRADTTTQWNSGKDPSALQHVANVGDATFQRQFPLNKWARGVAWDDGYIYTAPVGKFRPNAFGLHDMHGNVQEYCRDRFDATFYDKSPLVNPVGPLSGQTLFRGGSFLLGDPDYLRLALRTFAWGNTRTATYGFRVVWTIKRGGDVKVKIAPDRAEEVRRPEVEAEKSPAEAASNE